ncbi:Heterochromatin protein 1, partial [Fragariocoptes setiger]
MSDIEDSPERSDHEEEQPEAEEYVVEAVRDKKKIKGVTHYLLKWKGYPEEENTWEPHENLDCDELIETFEREWNKKQKAKKQEALSNKKVRPAAKKAAPVKSSKSKRDDSSGDEDDKPTKTGGDNSPSEGKKKSFLDYDDMDDDDDINITPAPKKLKTNEKSNNNSKKIESSEGESDSENVERRTNKSPTAGGGDNYNYVPEKIIGATENQGELMFLIKWKDINKADLINAKIARVACPQIVISFFEERLTWHTDAAADASPEAAVDASAAS